MLTQKRYIGIVVGVALLAGATAACSSSGSAGGSSSTKGATGSPIKVVSIEDPGSLSDDLYAGAQAAVSAINAGGGVNGRPLELSQCNTNNEAATTAQCAQAAVSNSAVVANVASVTGFSASSVPVLQAANMANVGPEPTSSSDFSSPISFPGVMGALGIIGQAKMMDQYLHANRLSIPYLENPAAAALPGLIKSVLPSTTVINSVAIPDPVADMTTYVYALQSQKPNAIVPAIQEDQVNSLLATSAQLQVKTPIALSPIASDAGALSKQFPSIPLYTAGLYNLNSSGYKLFAADMAKYQPKTALYDATLTGWFGVEMFKDVTSKLPTITRQSVLGAFKSTTDLNIGGLTPPLDFSERSTLGGGNFPSLINTNIYPYQIENGVYKSLNNYQPVQTLK